MFEFKIQTKVDEISSYRLNNLKRIASVTRIKKNDFQEPEEDKNRKNKIIVFDKLRTKVLDNLAALLNKNTKVKHFEAFY